MGLKSIANKLKQVTGDLQSLEVLTFSGDISLVYKSTAADQPAAKAGDVAVAAGEDIAGKTAEDGGAVGEQAVSFDWKAMQKMATRTDANVNLRLATYIDIDADAKHFVSDSGLNDHILKVHEAAVKNGSEYRGQVISFLAGKVADILD